ncbi:hypothetical protein [Neisseria sp. Ec49-e6-T10]|uniref:hypothetical protein n=1 Tax=Neisseria sp. Ec49-e6-T10 TaxID=3140744 RepID=UPI003EBB5448
MTTITTNRPSTLSKAHTEQALRKWYLVCDASHFVHSLEHDFTDTLCISESLLPQIRTIAMLIAASRHNFNLASNSPTQFTEEADWFAARILVLKAKIFHLDVSLLDMLKTANARAEQFAKTHGIDFTPAQAQLSLHAGRPQEMLIIESPLGVDEHIMPINILRNSQRIARLLHNII